MSNAPLLEDIWRTDSQADRQDSHRLRDDGRKSILANDSWCRASWQSRPGTFVSLMTLYESNYIRLHQLLGSLDNLPDQHISTPDNDCALHLLVDERSRYTTTFTLTYRFLEVDTEIADPDLQIRVYHDARLGEALRCNRWHRHPMFRDFQSALQREMDERWQRNMMLNKWLEYCLDRGHDFSAASMTAAAAT